MNRSIVLLLPLFFFSTFLHAQTVKIQGYAFSSIKDQRVSVQINDTISKLIHQDEMNLFTNFSRNGYEKLITETRRKGKFKIEASLKDSLSFRARFDSKQTYAVSDLWKKILC